MVQSYGSNCFGAPNADISSTDTIKVTIPIFDTTQSTTEADWQALSYTLAQSADGTAITYKPAEVSDNLPSAAGYVTNDISVICAQHYYPVNCYVYTISPRNFSALNNQLFAILLSNSEYQIGGDICVQYIPLNATTNCSRLMVRMYDTGTPTVLNQQFFTDPGAETLGIGTNEASACFRAESHVFNNEKILTSYGESIINQNSQWYG